MVRSHALPSTRTIRRRTPALAALGLVAASATFAVAPASAQERAEAAAREPALTVNGAGRVEVTPDRARISFAVETEAEAAREASEANATLMERVMAAVRETGIPDLRVETSGYTLTPRYVPRRDDRPQEIAGYTARNHVQVISDDVEAVGRIIDAALAAGANRVAGLSFEIRDAEPHRLEALREAVRKARGEAEVMAESLGMRLGDPIEVQGGAEIPPIRPFQQARAEFAMMADAAATTPVEAGLQTVTANVSIRYRLHPGG